MSDSQSSKMDSSRFYEDSRNWRNTSLLAKDPTPAGRRSEGWRRTGVGVTTFAVGLTVAIAISAGILHWLAVIVAVIGVGTLLSGLTRVVGSKGGARVVPCPACDNESNVLEDVNWYACPGCQLHTFTRAGVDIVQHECPYCTGAFAAATEKEPDLEDQFSCIRCGTALTIADGKPGIRDYTMSCWKCNRDIPRGADRCISCEIDVYSSTPQYGSFDALKEALKQLEKRVFWALAELKNIRWKDTKSLTEDGRVKERVEMIQEVELAIRVASEASEDAEAQRYVPDLLHALNYAYTRLIGDIARDSRGALGFPATAGGKVWCNESEHEYVKRRTWVYAQHKLLDRAVELGLVSEEDKYFKWADHVFVSWEIVDVSSTPTPTHRLVLTSTEELKEEHKRLDPAYYEQLSDSADLP